MASGSWEYDEHAWFDPERQHNEQKTHPRTLKRYSERMRYLQPSFLFHVLEVRDNGQAVHRATLERRHHHLQNRNRQRKDDNKTTAARTTDGTDR